MSHPARGAWIEMFVLDNAIVELESHPARGAWIEISFNAACVAADIGSHPARGAWIEIVI